MTGILETLRSRYKDLGYEINRMLWGDFNITHLFIPIRAKMQTQEEQAKCPSNFCPHRLPKTILYTEKGIVFEAICESPIKREYTSERVLGDDLYQICTRSS